MGGSGRQWGGRSQDSKGTWELLFGAKPEPFFKLVLLKYFGLNLYAYKLS